MPWYGLLWKMETTDARRVALCPITLTGSGRSIEYRSHTAEIGRPHPVCTDQGAIARYALDGLPNKILAAEYHTVLPDEQLLAEESARTRHEWEAQHQTVPRQNARLVAMRNTIFPCTAVDACLRKPMPRAREFSQ